MSDSVSPHRWQATKLLCPWDSPGKNTGVGCNRHEVQTNTIWFHPYEIPWLPWWLGGKEFACQCRRLGVDPWVRKIPWRRKWQLTPVFLPGKPHGQRSLVGYSPWGRKRVGHDLATKLQCEVPRIVKFMVWKYIDRCPGHGWGEKGCWMQTLAKLGSLGRLKIRRWMMMRGAWYCEYTWCPWTDQLSVVKIVCFMWLFPQ